MYILSSTVLLIVLMTNSLLADDKIKANSNNNNIPSERFRESSSDSLETNVTRSCNVILNKIIGKISSLQHDDMTTTRMSLMKTRILVNFGQYIAYPKEDGSFVVDNLPPDSYVVEATHPKYIYEPVRVDITSKGSIRARKVNYIRPTLVNTLEYPIRFRPISLHNYFVPRETWRIMDLLFNPMVIMMIVPLIIIWVLPKMMGPQEVQTQRDNVQMPEYNVPELSEMMASMFGRPGQPAGPNQSGSSGSSQQQSITAGGERSRHTKTKRR